MTRGDCGGERRRGREAKAKAASSTTKTTTTTRTHAIVQRASTSWVSGEGAGKIPTMLSARWRSGQGGMTTLSWQPSVYDEGGRRQPPPSREERASSYPDFLRKRRRRVSSRTDARLNTRGVLCNRARSRRATSSIYSNSQISREYCHCLLYTSPSPRDATLSRMPSSA